MPTLHQPKKINFVPPILRRRFIVPDNPRELGTLVAIIGLAISLISAGPTLSDLSQWAGKRQTEAKLVATVPFRANLESRLVGVYLFDDDNKAAVAPKALVVWRTGRSYKAKTLFQYLDYLLGLPIGLGILAWGLSIRVKRPDPFEEAMANRSDKDGSAS